MNFARDVVDAAPGDRLAIVALGRDGSRRELTFGEVSDLSARLAGSLAARGVGRGDVVMTLIGNRPEWVLAMVACFRLGAVVLPCTEQLRAKDLALRLEITRPAVVLADSRDLAELSEAAPDCPVLEIPDETLFAAEPAPAAELAPEDPCLITFTSGTAGEPKAVLHAQRYLAGQRVQAEHWLAPAAGDLVWCTAASGWSKSARNAFIAPWIRGAAALLHDARFDPAERLELLARERVNVLCMAPTEYRVIAKRATLCAAARPARARGRRRGAEPRGAADLARGDGARHPRRLRPDRDRAAHGHAGRRAGAAGLDGPRAAGRLARGRRRRAGRGPGDRADVLLALPGRGRRRPARGTPATA